VPDGTAIGEPRIAAQVATLFGAGPFTLVWADTFRIHCRTSPGFRRGRVLLAGDAAHLNSPAGGQGMNSGIQDAHNLAWKLARAGGSARPEPLLASYEAERRPAILTNVDRYTDWLTRAIFLSPRLVRDLAAAALARVARHPRLFRRIARRAAMLDTRYRRSPLLRGSGAWLGARAPDGPLRAAAVGDLRLLDLAAREAALLLFDDGRLPGWREAEVLGLLRDVPALRVHRIVPAAAASAGPALVDASGGIWRRWRPAPGQVALLRPDGHVGWMRARPSPEELREGVHGALGSPIARSAAPAGR
jgi:hypothetical protein